MSTPSIVGLGLFFRQEDIAKSLEEMDKMVGRIESAGGKLKALKANFDEKGMAI